MLDTLNPNWVKAQPLVSGSSSFREVDTGAIEVDFLHFSHSSELGYHIRVYAEETSPCVGWGTTIFDGSIKELIELIQSAKRIQNREMELIELLQSAKSIQSREIENSESSDCLPEDTPASGSKSGD